MLKSDRIPITIGVVGHLDIIETEDDRLQIKRLFEDLAAKYSDSPIRLFSSLAEGADRFVANIFLDLKNGNDNYESRFDLIVPMPFNTDEYKKDFDDESNNEFDSLLEKAGKSFCVSCGEDETDRSLQYLKAGKFVADSSIILIAMWDGQEGKKGGTADIIKHKITGDNENVAESTFEYDGTVFIIPCKRNKSSYKVSVESGKEVKLSLDWILKDKAIKDTLEKIDEINSESVMIELSEFDRSRSYMFNHPDKLDTNQNLILNWYSIFDIFSLGFRRKDIRISVWLFILGFFFIVSLEVYSNLFVYNFALGLVLLLNVFAAIIYFYSRTRKYHEKYLYNRTLAEALRIQFFWNIAGISKNVSDYILRIHRKDFTWVKHFLSAMYGVTYSNKSISSETIVDLTDNWIKNQADFFRISIIKMTKQMRFYHSISNISFIAAFVLLGSIFFLGDLYTTKNLLNGIFVLIGTFLSLFALIRGYIQMKGYNQLLNQYELMNVIYQRAESKIAETDTYELDQDQKNSYLQELFFVIGKEALIENGNWYLIFKEKEPEIEGI